MLRHRYSQPRPSALSTLTRPSVLVVLIVALLGTLTALQYRWIGELSAFQRQQMERTLRSSTDRFARDLEREFERLWYVFNVRGERRAAAEIAEDYTEWVESTGYPDLVAAAYWVRDEGAGDASSQDRLSAQRVPLDGSRFEPVPWPPALDPLRAPLTGSSDEHRGRRFHRSDGFTMALADGSLAFVVAQTSLDPKAWVVAVLRREVLTGALLPALVDHHFGPPGERVYEVRLRDTAGDDLLYASAGSASTSAPADYTRTFREYGGMLSTRQGGDIRTLVVATTHRAGSVGTAVAQLRNRNLGFSFGVVLVLVASVVILGVAARRARRLAARQMEFVAGVSHELRTPIAGISSLSQNLADGVVDDLQQAARYGETIHKESRRLGNMVEGVLHFSAIRAGHGRYEMGAVDVGTLVGDALDSVDPRLTRRVTLEVDVPRGLPQLHGDERALRSVVRNLVSNAMKFSPDGSTARLSAAAEQGRNGIEVELRVEDSGPGIGSAEVAHIFEPFFRGAAALDQQVEGSGLGLSLVKEIVEAHGGRVEVNSDAGAGSVFSVFLPVQGASAEAHHGHAFGEAGLQGAGDGGKTS